MSNLSNFDVCDFLQHEDILPHDLLLTQDAPPDLASTGCFFIFSVSHLYLGFPLVVWYLPFEDSGFEATPRPRRSHSVSAVG